MLRGSRFYRAVLVIAVLALLAASFPQPVNAAVATIPSSAVIVHFDVIAVKADQNITIRTKDFPIRTRFTVRMDVVGKKGVGGTVVTEFNSNQGGVFEATYPIPENLHGQLILAVRIESVDGYEADNWFFNEDTLGPLPNRSAKPEVSFSEVKKGATVTVQASNLPANTLFWVRIGPYYTFYQDYKFADMVTTGADGSAKFSLNVPESMKNADYLMVRLDRDGLYAFNVYQNIDGGAAAEVKKLYKFEWCKMLYIYPIEELGPGQEFDVVWRIQNTSNMNWDAGSIGYKFLSGEKMHKYKDNYTINWGIGDGRSFDVAVDMIAPQEPGWHTTTWTMVRDDKNRETDTNMCQMKISVFVKGSK